MDVKVVTTGISWEGQAMDPITRGKPLKSICVDSAKVRLFAESYGVSIREIARRMGVSNTLLLRILRHEGVSPARAAKLVEVLGEIGRTMPLAPFSFLMEIPDQEAAKSIHSESQRASEVA